jgi:hypothetical protein
MRLDMRRNDVLMPAGGGAVYRQMLKAGVYNQLQHMPPNCFYHGRVLGGDSENTLVALSTCDGLR